MCTIIPITVAKFKSQHKFQVTNPIQIRDLDIITYSIQDVLRKLGLAFLEAPAKY